MKAKIIEQLNLLNNKILALIEQNSFLYDQNQELERQNTILKDFQDKIVIKLGDFSTMNAYKNINTNKEKMSLVSNKDIIFLHNGIKETIASLISEIDKVKVISTQDQEVKQISKTSPKVKEAESNNGVAAENILFHSFMYNPLQQFIITDNKNLSSRLINDIKYFFSECKIVLSDEDYTNFIDCLSKTPKTKISSVIFNSLKYHPYLMNKLNKIVS